MTETATPAVEQFLRILSREEAEQAFRAALQPHPVRVETLPLALLPGRVLARDIRAEVDAPPFDRSVVDGFALRSEDTREASESRPVRLRLNPESLSCGQMPRVAVECGTATPIATGAPLPRGADAVAMLENCVISGECVELRKAHAPAQNMAFAGSDISRGQTLLYRGTVITAREVAMLAAVGVAEAEVWGQPRIAVISTGDELVAVGQPLRDAGIFDSNGPVVTAALAEQGCLPISYGIVRDDADALAAIMQRALSECDGLVLSGGTSKGAGDLTYRLINGLGQPGIVAHGVALKPGKPLCLAVCDGKPVVALPGFPTSAMFTFHDLVAPVFRALAGLPEHAATEIAAELPVRLPSEFGRREYVMVSVTQGETGLVAYPIGKGSGAVTAFSQADGFITIDAMADHQAPAQALPVRLFSPRIELPRLTIIGSHCIGLDAIMSRLNEAGIRARILAIGSLGGIAALRRGECDIAPVHILDPESGAFNRGLEGPGTRLVKGWRRMQGIVHRRDDPRFSGRTAADAIAHALEDRQCLMIGRNPGAGTRILIDRLLGGARPQGYLNQPRSHNAVAAAVAQGRADWGVAIEPVARALELGFIPLVEEHYDFLVADRPAHAAAIMAFEEALQHADEALRLLGFNRG